MLIHTYILNEDDTFACIAFQKQFLYISTKTKYYIFVIHRNLDFCALEICVFNFCGVLNYRHPLKFAGQNLDFCGKIAQKSKILWKINSFFPTNQIFSLISLICFENFYVQGLYVIQKRYIRRLLFQLYLQMCIKYGLWTQLLHKYTLKICGFLKFAVFLQSGSRITTYV